MSTSAAATVRGASTAFSVAVQRAAHHFVDAPPHIFNDVAGWKLLTDEERTLVIERPHLFANAIARALRLRVLVRQRYAEQALQNAVARGARQYVILGAGMDSFALRQPDWAAGLQIFEVDRREEQARKHARIGSSGLSIPPNLTMIEADFDRDPLLETLKKGGVDPMLPSFISCLGVLVYLSPQGIDQVLELPRSMPSRTEMVFTVATPATNAGDGIIARFAAAAGEPWVSVFDHAGMVERLRAMGYLDVARADPDVLVEHLDADAARLVQTDNTLLFKVTA